MSNANVGSVYQQIIQDVIEASRVDFEEGGIDESVLEELKKGWQKKLSQQGLAVFPWDPRPDPPAAPAPAAQPPSVPDVAPPQSNPPNGAAYAQQQTTPAPGLSLPPMPTGPPSAETRVKMEPGVKVEPGLEGTPNMSQATRPAGVQERVIQQLQSQYGDRAAGSIDKLKAGMAIQSQNGSHQQGPPRHAGIPMPGQYQGNPQQQYRQNLPAGVGAQQQQQQQQQQRAQPHPANGQRPPPAPSQMDGAGDEESHVGVLVHQNQNGESTELGRVQIDNMLHAQIAARAKAMEGGGLMVPLQRASKRKPSISYHRTPGANAGPSRFDGPGDDDESEDEDAINSDLDDSEDNIDDDDEDEDGGQIMLCMYDKVQRVKNKWKCVLKDGVLSVNGKDYVFHKATGEYEW
ncbi:hypothetical protein DL771_010161 [Monosporascus sp. 5C6A]|nr:hypothetical protein DL771_010161 [Monosporascus sp. 5C6A]